MAYSKTIVAGNLGRDPESKYTPQGTMICNFSVAENRTVKGEKVTIWYRVTTWDKLAETCNQYLKKGSKVIVEGQIVADTATGGPRLWTGKDGNPRASFEINAQTVRFLSTRQDDAQNERGDVNSGGSPANHPPEEGLPW